MVPSWQINSLHIIPGVKSGLNFQRFCSLIKDQSFCQTNWRGKQLNIFCIFPVFPLFVDSSFYFSWPEWREGEGEAVRWQAHREMCFSRAHIKCTWKTTAPQRIVAYPQGHSTEAMTEVIYIAAILGFWCTLRQHCGDIHSFFCFFLYFYSHPSYLNITHSLRWQPIRLLIRHGFCPVRYSDIIRHHFQQCDLKVIVSHVCTLSGYLASLLQKLERLIYILMEDGKVVNFRPLSSSPLLQARRWVEFHNTPVCE